MWWWMVVAVLASRGLALSCLSKQRGSKVLLNGKDGDGEENCGRWDASHKGSFLHLCLPCNAPLYPRDVHTMFHVHCSYLAVVHMEFTYGGGRNVNCS